MELGNSELNIYIIKSPTLIVFHRHEAFIWKIVILIMKLRAHACWIPFHPSPPRSLRISFPICTALLYVINTEPRFLSTCPGFSPHVGSVLL